VNGLHRNSDALVTLSGNASAGARGGVDQQDADRGELTLEGDLLAEPAGR
jgi:hypothetical protein